MINEPEKMLEGTQRDMKVHGDDAGKQALEHTAWGYRSSQSLFRETSPTSNSRPDGSSALIHPNKWLSRDLGVTGQNPVLSYNPLMDIAHSSRGNFDDKADPVRPREFAEERKIKSFDGVQRPTVRLPRLVEMIQNLQNRVCSEGRDAVQTVRRLLQDVKHSNLVVGIPFTSVMLLLLHHADAVPSCLTYLLIGLIWFFACPNPRLRTV